QRNQDDEPEKGAGTAWGAAPRRFQVRGFPIQVQGELALFAGDCRVVARRGAVRISGHGVFLDVPLIRRCTAGEAVPVSGGTGVAWWASLWMASTNSPRRRCHSAEVRCSTIVRSSAMW